MRLSTDTKSRILDENLTDHAPAILAQYSHDLADGRAVVADMFKRARNEGDVNGAIGQGKGSQVKHALVRVHSSTWRIHGCRVVKMREKGWWFIERRGGRRELPRPKRLSLCGLKQTNLNQITPGSGLVEKPEACETVPFQATHGLRTRAQGTNLRQ